MKRAGARRRSRGGFTLIELITVVAILCILVALVVGGVMGIKNYWSRIATTQMFEALDGALRQYYQDYNNYPWMDTTRNPKLDANCGDFAAVDATLWLPTGTNGVPDIDQPAATLFAALNARRGHGAAFPGGTGETLMKKVVSATGAIVYSYYVYTDGWGRQIYYWPPNLAVSNSVRTRTTPTGEVTFVLPDGSFTCPIHGEVKLNAYRTCPTCGRKLICPSGPVLESLGSYENDDADNLVNWGTILKN